jgi:hypothetical protein
MAFPLFLLYRASEGCSTVAAINQHTANPLQTARVIALLPCAGRVLHALRVRADQQIGLSFAQGASGLRQADSFKACFKQLGANHQRTGSREASRYFYKPSNSGQPETRNPILDFEHRAIDRLREIVRNRPARPW